MIDSSDRTERIAIEVIFRVSKVSMVECVESLKPQLHIPVRVSGKVNVLGQAKVRIVKAGTMQEVAWHVAEGSSRLRRERRRVEVLVTGVSDVHDVGTER